MSRIGKQPIKVPAGVEIKLDGNHITVKGPKGELVRDIHPEMILSQNGDELVVDRPSEERIHKGLHGLTRTLINNMVLGVADGFEKGLEIHGVGYRAALKGNDVEIAAGFSHPVVVPVPKGLSIEIPTPTRIAVKGVDKELVGQFAANLRKIRPPEPYKGKGIRYVGEVVRRKVGKTGK